MITFLFAVSRNIVPLPIFSHIKVIMFISTKGFIFHRIYLREVINVQLSFIYIEIIHFPVNYFLLRSIYWSNSIYLLIEEVLEMILNSTSENKKSLLNRKEIVISCIIFNYRLFNYYVTCQILYYFLPTHRKPLMFECL